MSYRPSLCAFPPPWAFPRSGNATSTQELRSNPLLIRLRQPEGTSLVSQEMVLAHQLLSMEPHDNPFGTRTEDLCADASDHRIIILLRATSQKCIVIWLQTLITERRVTDKQQEVGLPLAAITDHHINLPKNWSNLVHRTGNEVSNMNPAIPEGLHRP